MNHITPTNLSYLVDIPQIEDEGRLCFVEGFTHVPFELKRIYYIFDVEQNAVRGFHAHKKTRQMLFCIRGSITIHLDDGTHREQVALNDPKRGIFLDALMWHEMSHFTPDTVLLVLASDVYRESDYIRDYSMFLKYRDYFKNTHGGVPFVHNFTPVKTRLWYS